MKKTFLLAFVMVVVTGLLVVHKAAAQNTSVTLNLQNVPLERVLSEIERQTNYLFLYNDRNVDVKKNTSILASDESLNEVLDQLFADTGITWSIERSNIHLKSQPQTVAANTVRSLEGRVTDNGGEPLAGVMVFVKGTQRGTTTSSSGTFNLTVEESDRVLTFSYLGTEPRDVPIGDTRVFNVSLVDQAVEVDQVVVTALGIKRSEKALNYNVQVLDNEALTTVSDANFVTALSGKIAGLVVNQVAGGVGSATRVTSRGVRSIAQTDGVLYVIDGMPMYNFQGEGLSNEFESEVSSEGIADINSEDIESVTMLTGAAAGALYGHQGARGAMLITTKRGEEGKIKISLSNQTTFMTPLLMPEFQTKYGNVQGSYESWGDVLPTPSTYEAADFFNTGTNITNSVSLSTGNQKNQTYVSAATTNAAGIVSNNKYDRYNFTFRNTTELVEDKLSLDFRFEYVQQSDRNMISQGEYFNPLPAVYTFPRGENFDPVRMYERFNAGRNIYTQFWPYGDQNMSMQNPYWMANRNLMEHSRKRYTATPTLSYKINDWLSAVGRLRIDNAYSDNTKKLWATTNALLAGGTTTEESKGYYSLIEQAEEQLYMDAVVTASKTCGDYSFNVNVGASYQDSRMKNAGTGGTLEAIPNTFELDNIYQPGKVGARPWREQTQSVFGAAEIGYGNMLFLTVTGRNDWNSTLAGMPQTSFFYPSVGISAIVSDMVEMPDAISYLKLRGALAYVGGGIPRGITGQAYQSTNLPSVYIPDTYQRLRQLHPEMTRSWEAGLDMRLFDNTIRLEATYYRTNTFDQVILLPLPSGGTYSHAYHQTGNVQNEGVELQLSVQPRWRNFKWTPGLMASYNKNTIVDLGGRDVWGDAAMQYNVISSGSMHVRLTPGGSMGDLWASSDLATDDNGNVFVNKNGGILVESLTEYRKVGSIMPDWKLGFGNTFQYKGITLSALVAARLGGQVFSRTQAILDSFGVSQASADMRDRGGMKINNGMVSAETWYKAVGGKQGVYRFYVYDADNVRLQEVSLGYALPSKWFGDVLRMRVSAVGRNLWMIYNKAPFDPEASASVNDAYQGLDYFMQPSLKNFGFSVKVDF